MWKGSAALAAIGIVLLAGTALAPPGFPYIDVRPDPYQAGEPVTVRLSVVNPTPTNATYSWSNSCVFSRISVVSEKRVLVDFHYTMETLCLQVMIGIVVPANSSYLWFVWTYDTQPDDGCLWINVTMRNYPVSGSGEACPGPAPPPLRAMALTVSAPASVTSGALFDLAATARTSDGAPIEGIRVHASLGSAYVGTAATGPDGIARMSARAPSVNATTSCSLLVQASGSGYYNATRPGEILIFPPSYRHLVLQASLPTGDLIESGGAATVELVVLGDDGFPAANRTVAVLPEAPLRLADNKDLGGGRYELALRADHVDNGRVATVRVVASAPGYGDGMLQIEYVVLGVPTPPPETRPGPPPTFVDPAPLVVIGVAVAAAVALVVVRARRRRTRR